MNKTIQTYSKIYQDYADHNQKVKLMKPYLNRFIKLLNGKNILDVGCANGRDSKYFYEKELKVTGIDLTPEFIKLAKINCPKCAFQVMDMTNLDFQPKSFNGIWASASLLHIHKKEILNTLKGFSRVISDNGILYISLMEGVFEGYRKNTQLNWDDRYFSEYSIEEITEILMTAHFKIVDVMKKKVEWGPTFLHVFCRKI